jgi:hypothetical protein
VERNTSEQFQCLLWDGDWGASLTSEPCSVRTTYIFKTANFHYNISLKAQQLRRASALLQNVSQESFCFLVVQICSEFVKCVDVIWADWE